MSGTGSGNGYINASTVTTEQFTVSGMEADDTSATVTFSDAGKTVMRTVGGNGTYTVDLSSLSDGTVTPTLQVANDPAGNTFLPVTGTSVTLDTTAPTVSGIADNPASEDLGVGATVALSMGMSEAVTVTGTPTLVLNNGGTAKYTGGSGSSTLTFSYTVGSGQSVSDLAVKSVNLAGGAAITDIAGNTGALSGAAVNPAGRLIIDTTSNRAGLVGNPGHTTLTGTSGNDVIDISAAGASYTVSAGGVNDTIVVGSALLVPGNTTTIDGGAGSNAILLFGDYSGGVTLGANTVTNVQTFTFADGSNYNLTLNAATVASGSSLTLDASSLAPINSATLNGSAVGAGRTLSFLGGSGNDVLSGGAGTNLMYGAAGADVMNAGSGTDTFSYRLATDSPFVASSAGASDDTINGMLAGTDKLDLRSLLLSQKTVLDKGSVASFTDATTAGYFSGGSVAVEYGAGSSAQVFVDTNRDGILDSGDMMMKVNGVAAHSLGNSSFLM